MYGVADEKDVVGKRLAHFLLLLGHRRAQSLGDLLNRQFHRAGTIG